MQVNFFLTSELCMEAIINCLLTEKIPHIVFFLGIFFLVIVYVCLLSIAPEEHEIWLTESCAKTDLIIHHEAWLEATDWFDIT
jgi:hypothetical protein